MCAQCAAHGRSWCLCERARQRCHGNSFKSMNGFKKSNKNDNRGCTSSPQLKNRVNEEKTAGRLPAISSKTAVVVDDLSVGKHHFLNKIY